MRKLDQPDKFRTPICCRRRNAVSATSRDMRGRAMSKNTLRPVSVVTASAGTGKTYDLTSRIKDAIVNGRDPEKVLASTFTVKAAEELRERARGRLIGDGGARRPSDCSAPG